MNKFCWKNVQHIFLVMSCSRHWHNKQFLRWSKHNLSIIQSIKLVSHLRQAWFPTAPKFMGIVRLVPMKIIIVSSHYIQRYCLQNNRKFIIIFILANHCLKSKRKNRFRKWGWILSRMPEDHRVIGCASFSNNMITISMPAGREDQFIRRIYPSLVDTKLIFFFLVTQKCRVVYRKKTGSSTSFKCTSEISNILLLTKLSTQWLHY